MTCIIYDIEHENLWGEPLSRTFMNSETGKRCPIEINS